MLERIVLENFKSFKERTVIDFTKTNYTFLPENVSDSGILKGAIFVGANASGKSNIILSIRNLLELLYGEVDIFDEGYRCIYSPKPNYSLEYFFRVDGSSIQYLIEIDLEKHIVSEKLYLDSEIMVERIGDNAKSYIADKKGIVYDEKDVDDETLFVRTLYFNTKFASESKLKAWMEFIMNSVYLNMFKNAGITSDVKEVDLVKYLEKNGDDEINKFLKKYNFEQEIKYDHKVKGKDYHIAIGGDENKKTIFFKKKGIDAPIPIHWESQGNQNLMKILPILFYVLNKNGMLIVDEFSSGFHNELEALLVKYFMEKSINSQMFFVSHSTNLLSNSLLRPDQEYAVSLTDERGSRIKRFSDEQPRSAQNIEKMYVSGVFGGLPNYKEDTDEN